MIAIIYCENASAAAGQLAARLVVEEQFTRVQRRSFEHWAGEAEKCDRVYVPSRPAKFADRFRKIAAAYQAAGIEVVREDAPAAAAAPLEIDLGAEKAAAEKTAADAVRFDAPRVKPKTSPLAAAPVKKKKASK